jgi:uncharacterized protein (DUF1499 family)
VLKNFCLKEDNVVITCNKNWRPNKMTTEQKYMGKLEGNSGVGPGLADGQLAACPNKPNCVSSQAAPSDRRHYIEALTYSDGPAQARERFEQTIAGMPSARVVVREANYWRAEFTSRLWRFVDDVEFLFDDDARRIDIRSASRVGYGDFGVNRRRIEEIRRGFSGH